MLENKRRRIFLVSCIFFLFNIPRLSVKIDVINELQNSYNYIMTTTILLYFYTIAKG